MPRGIPGSGGGNYGLTIHANVKGQRNIKRLGNSMQGVQGKAKNLAMSFKGLAKPLAAIALAAGTFKALKSSFEVLAEREADFATLANGLTRVSTDAPKAAKALRVMADELGFETLFDEKAFQKGFALLTSFKNIGLDSYGRVAETAADLAQINQVDLKSSFLQLAKALSDPTRGLTALSRSGVIFTEQQREMILELHKSGRQMEAQAEILRIVEGSYKGAARAAAEGLAGAFDTLRQKVRDFNEALGGAAEPFMEPLVRATTEVFDVVTDGLNAISDDMVVFAKNIETALRPVFKWLIENLKNILGFFDQLFATQRNLREIQIKQGDGEFQKIRKDLLKQASDKALSQQKQFIPDDSFGERVFGVLKNPSKLLKPIQQQWKQSKEFNELRDDIFNDLVSDYVENVLGVKAIKPAVEEVTVSMDGQVETLKGLKKVSIEAGKSLKEVFSDNMKSKLDSFGETLNDFGSLVGDTIVKAFKGLEDTLVNFVTTGKLQFKSLVQSIIADLARLTIRKGITQPLFNAFSSALGGALSGGGMSANGFFDPQTGLGTAGPNFGLPAKLATGGFISKPTNALVGESGSEYVIRSDQMDQAMRRYAKGARGQSVIDGVGGSEGESGHLVGAGAIDVRFDVQRINAVDYVTAQQFEQGIRSATEQGARKGEQMTLRRLQTSPNTRKRIGV